MKEEEEKKARVNPAARHDDPGATDPVVDKPRTRDHQVKGKQDEELNPLDPGGIGD